MTANTQGQAEACLPQPNKDFSQKREEILEMIWNMEEEIMGKDN